MQNFDREIWKENNTLKTWREDNIKIDSRETSWEYGVEQIRLV
jgi:hypothetical protein